VEVGLEILAESERRFVASFYARFFRDAKWVRDLERIDEVARAEAEKHGLGAMDALHLAAAHVSGAAEMITTEKRSKPIHRSSLVKVVYLYQSR
jgi:predicted nucleic acid-binding protein